ncbi:MAG: OstA-like protein, partial [Rhodothermales bacterium]
MMRRLAVHISIFLSFCGVALAQERDTVRTREVEVSANLLEGDAVNGERIRRLTGDVRLRQEETRLWARRAVQYLDRREILFTGDVLVVERGDTLRADTVLYNSRLKTGSARGRVRLSDGDVFVRAPSGLYFTREKRAQFTDGVTLIDSSAVLTSRGGEYWSDEKRAEFYGEVRLD